MRFTFDARKSHKLRANPKRGIGFEEAQEVFSQPYYLDQRVDVSEQYRAIGWGWRDALFGDFRSSERQRRRVLPPSDAMEGNERREEAL